VLYSLITVAQNAGVRDVQSVNVNITHYDALTQTSSIETFFSSIPLPNEWTAAYCRNVTITLVNPVSNQSFEYSYGKGGDLD